MTLDTRIRIVEPTPVRPIFDEARRLIGGENARYRHVFELTEQWQRNPFYANKIQQGLPVLLSVAYGPDGPLRDYDEGKDCTYWYECTPPVHRCPPKASIEVSFNTAYGYKAENGAGCSDLHAWLIVELGRWLTERRLSWYWLNEFTGEWHPSAEHPSSLGNPTLGRPLNCG